MKREYRIPLVWQMYGHVWVEADSEDEAIEKALDSETPLPDGEYIDGSCEFDEGGLIEVKEWEDE